LDVTQIPIKINQTKQTGGAKAKEPHQDGMDSFNQILAMFNINSLSSESNGQSAASGFENAPSTADSNENKPKNLNEVDLKQLESLLAELISLIQQGQSLPAIPFSQQAGSSLKSESNTLASTMVGTLQKGTEGTSKNQTQIIQQLSQLIENLHNEGDQTSFQVPPDIRDKIQMMFDELKKESNFDGKLSLSSSNYQNTGQFDNKKQESSFEINSRLSLDKNQVVLSSIPSRNTSNKDEDRLIRLSLPNQENDPGESSGIMSMVNHPLREQEVLGMAKMPSLPATLSISEFAPEVSEWIGRYMKITNGQSGGTEATVSLYPEHLGHIEIKITSQDGQVSAQIATSTTMAKEALEGQVQHLKQVLQDQGLLVQKLDIIQQPQKVMDLNQAGMSFFQGGSSSSDRQKSFTADKESSKKSNQKEQDQENIVLPYGGASQVIASSRIDFTA
jgi:flagellar hook-length control protein FliK